MSLAVEFRQRHGVTLRDFKHLLHGQLTQPWGNDSRAHGLAVVLLEDMARLAHAELFEVILGGRLHTDTAGGISLVTVLGYEGMRGQGMELLQFARIRAAAAVLCRLGDLLDAEQAAAQRAPACTCAPRR